MTVLEFVTQGFRADLTTFRITRQCDECFLNVLQQLLSCGSSCHDPLSDLPIDTVVGRNCLQLITECAMLANHLQSESQRKLAEICMSEMETYYYG